MKKRGGKFSQVDAEKIVKDIQKIEEDKKEVEKHFPEAPESRKAAEEGGEPDNLLDIRLAMAREREEEAGSLTRPDYSPKLEKSREEMTRKEIEEELSRSIIPRKPLPLEMQVEFWITEGYSDNEIMAMIGEQIDFTQPFVSRKGSRKGAD